LKQANVAIIGTKFMGKAHSHARNSVTKFFNVGITPVLKVACGQDEQSTRDFAQRWSWEASFCDGIFSPFHHKESNQSGPCDQIIHLADSPWNGGRN
jgi:hypothetical protein